MRLPAGATRLSAAGSTRTSAPEPRRDWITNARRSTARGSSLSPENVGWLESRTRSWATQAAGRARIAVASSASSSRLACGPMTMPCPP